ncbi:MAG TPA: EamA family transporter [Dongiaceae bacterium]|nr:EamA family transporter [Dongiaceae bacterium]
MQAAAPRGELAASAGLLFTAIACGTMVPLTAVLLQDLPPFVIAASRYSMAALVLAGIVAARERTPVLPLGLPWGRILLLGGAGIGCFATGYTFGIRYSGPIAAAAILATQPVVAAPDGVVRHPPADRRAHADRRRIGRVRRPAGRLWRAGCRRIHGPWGRSCW